MLDTSQPPPSAAVEIVRAWVRGALALEAGRAPSDAAPGAAASTPELIEAVRRHRVAEVLAPHTEDLGVPAVVAEAVAHFRQAGRRATTVQVLETGRVHGLLVAAGIASLVIKGPALAVVSSGDPTARGPGDIDVLVDPDQLEDAHTVLVENGWHPRPSSSLTPGTWAWRHAVLCDNAFAYDGPGSSIDLHWRLDPTLDGLPGFAEVWSRRQQAALGHGLVVPTLGARDALAHSCLHSAKDSWRWLRSLVDVHRLAGLEATWADPGSERLRRLERATLAVTGSMLGLPDGMPSVPLAPSAVRRARAAQERPTLPTRPFPGVATARQVRYLLAASPTRRDIAHTVLCTSVPVTMVLGIEASSARTGVPLALWHRLRRLRRRLVAWARGEPGAGMSG